MKPALSSTSKLAFILLILGISGCASRPTPLSQIPEPELPAVPQSQAVPTGSIYQANAERSLFEDRTARRVGDVITVVLVERTNASKSASTNASKSQDVDIAQPTVLGHSITYHGAPILSASAKADRAFQGKGDSQQSNSLSGNITVQVVGRHPNGNLLIKGEKWITLNQGQELVKIAGIVRPTDIGTDNTVLSTQVADARITYSGRGAIADSNAMGWAARFFNSPWWPF